MDGRNAPDNPPARRRTALAAAKHRGGAWKVAYADFVTALMALFIVLWLMNTSRQVQQSISSYFRDPRAHSRLDRPAAEGSGPAAGGIELNQLNAGELRDRLEAAISAAPELGRLKDQVRISVTVEGLRVELMETEQGLFFESGRPEPSANGERMLALLAGELARLKNRVLVEGHTDARPYRFTAIHGYTNWELSVDRANAARRVMEDRGLSSHQIAQVRGFADRRLLDAGSPQDSRNRRISVVVEYDEPAALAKPTPFGEPPPRAPLLRH